MTDDDFIPYDMPREKRRRALRVHINKKLKGHDRYKVKLAKRLPDGAEPKYRRFDMWKREDYRSRVPTETGYGVAFEYDRTKLE